MHQSVGSNLFSLPFLSVCIRESSEPNMLSDLLALASLAVIIVIIVLVVVNKFRRQRTARRRLLLANRTLDELETAMNGPGFQDEMDFERYKELILFTRQLCLTISDSIKPGQKINWPSVFLDTGRLHGRLDVCETETRAWLKRIAEAKKIRPPWRSILTNDSRNCSHKMTGSISRRLWSACSIKRKAGERRRAHTVPPNQ